MTGRLARILRALAVDADLLRRRRELRLLVFGNAEAGAAAALLGVRASIVAGGALCVVGCGAVTAALPRLWASDSRQIADRILRSSGSDVTGF